MSSLSSISVVIPTLNAASVLKNCLQSIANQNYPREKIEIIIADGGSTDRTVEIARKYQAKIVANKLKTGEAGKAAGIKKAANELVALIDSDNILPTREWCRKMVAPFKDEEIIASEPIEYAYRKSDPLLTRYFALLGMSDPLCLFLGNYDRKSALTGRWTNLKFEQKDSNGYLKIKFDRLPLPTIGANGTIYRREKLPKIGDYFFDIDIPVQIFKERGPFYFAKVKTGIIHTYVEGDIVKFFRKQWRRVSDFSYHKTQRQTSWENAFLPRILYFQLQCLLIFPIIYQMIKGYVRKPDTAWLFHPLACYSTWFIYLLGWVKGKTFPAESSRAKWRQ